MGATESNNQSDLKIYITRENEDPMTNEQVNGSSGRVNLVYVAAIKTINIHELHILHIRYIYIHNTLRLLYTLYMNLAISVTI